MAGYKGKNLGKIITVAGTTAALTLSFVGFNIFHRETARPTPEKVDPSYGITDTAGDTIFDREEHTLAQEPDIITEAETYIDTEATRPTRPDEFETETEAQTGGNFDYSQSPTPENPVDTSTDLAETEPSIDTDISTDTDVITDTTSEDVVEILATLTSWFQEYMQDTYNLSQAPNLTAISIDSASIDYDYGTIQLKGSVKTDNKIRTFTADIANENTALGIYNLSTSNMSAQNLNSSLVELKNSDETEMSLKLGQFIKINNPTSVISSMLQSRYNDVSKINSSNTKTEAKYLSAVLKSVDACSIRVSTPTGIATEDGFRYSFGTYVNTGKYTYYATCYFTSEQQLDSAQLEDYVNNYLQTKIASATIYVTPNSAVNQTIHEINQQAEIDNQTGLTK